jgi:paraquat-inducible protein A
VTEFDPISAAERSLARCHSCGRVEPVDMEHCPRCHAPLHLRKPDSLQRTVALTIGAVILYFPANLLPVLRVESTLSGTRQSTIISGVVQFWQEGDYPVAAIIFLASVMIPVLKVLAILVLCLGAHFGYRPRVLTQLYRITEYIGVVQLGSVIAINAGEGAFAFAGVVVLTMLASHSFDPRLIWDAAAKNQQRSGRRQEET